MKNYKSIFLAVAVVVAASSCSDKVRIDGTVEGAPESKIVVKQLSGSTFTVLDTVKTDGSGAYSYKMEVSEGQPQFVYVFKDDVKIASLLLSKGDRVKVVSDTLGNYTVEGSEESARLKEVETDFASFLADFNASVRDEDGAAASRKYIDYYRSRVKYVMDNSKSLTSIPVLFQKVGEDFPVFSQSTDGVLFRGIHDSLMTVYPESKYVAALGKEAERRMSLLALDQRLQSAGVTGFPDVELPSTDGKKVRLGSLDSKVVMVHFWQAADASQKMFNQDVLLPLYKTYNPKGLEIYSISLDTDKGTWASAVKSQGLPWINVCDGRGAATQAVSLYNISTALPVAYLIVDGTLLPESFSDESGLRRILSANLK